MFKTVADLLELTKRENVSIAEIMVRQEILATESSREEVIDRMKKKLTIMENAISQGLAGVKSITGLTGGDAVLMKQYIESKKGLSGDIILNAVAKAVATNEVNAAMGIICANPTAGSAGTVPGVLFAVKEKLQATEEQMLEFLFTAAAFGIVTANNASISGAAGGCQAEVGTASGMAAAGAVAMAGGTPKQCATAFSIALKNLLGLVCDPVAGLVEVPCVKRNAGGASNALIAADMALAGIISAIPCDEVINAMYSIGRMMPLALRETAEGGLAATPTGRKLEAKIFNK
ncbi:L-serine ammonia-lyase, iron-sulfur-dependent, subunit alpha [Bacillus bingmayongensis]|uniref:L-serine ammonia-lyase, iron-sulfur-dependent, subunit alpha n=1 Tax=Bacillus bingmayongensis TaxID=1150157 RepID=UPI001C8D5536|nr:L-serine ammonia-lyase, iron-sulfur-dependent, subunit alpha [Bacillus bingmayongensis]MBY0600015.1 L-serine ammonia-lyase, iron-sulfur-dependent, subunit alpha [Bacillus bingmayongensis]